MGLGKETDCSESDCTSVKSVEQICYESITSDAQKSKPKTFTKKKIIIFGCVVYGHLILGSCFSLMAPFFPAEAEKKGASATEYGLIFGVFPLTVIFVSPAFGKLMAVLQPGFLLKSGLFATGIASILFGTLHHSPAGKSFVALAFLIRMAQAIAVSAYRTAAMTMLSCEFSDIIGRAVSILETADCVGLAIGPVIGSFLYNAGGFGTPFYAVGALLVLGSVAIIFLNPAASMNYGGNPGSTRAILADFDLMMDILAGVGCSLSLGFNEATLEPHLRQFHLSATAVGGIFVIEGVVDASTAFPWGYFAEKVSNAQYLTMIAVCLMAVAFLITGPAPFFPFPPLLWLIIFAQFLIGLGLAGQSVCCSTHAIKSTVERGFPADVATFGFLSGILSSSASFGSFIGPSVGGIFVDHFGYRNATLFAVAVPVATFLLMSGRILWKKCQGLSGKLNLDVISDIPTIEKAQNVP